ncbi:MAG: NAD-dependent epimerase/dehydratase family protein [Chloroflexi bacterium]|nr:NAD-dependent epimerase/dehydratase family protein [Chloroflexota bacterium]
MKLLILGGTVFLGRHLVTAAQVRGHEVTLFNRGQHNPELFPAVEKLRGDRDGDLSALAGRRWDAVIDPSGYVPRLVAASAALLADAVEHYTFVSSLSAYANFAQPNQDEGAPLATMDDPTVEAITGETYGPLKVLSEEAAQTALPGRVAVIRPGLIVGPHDPTDRFTYWPVRVATGGDILAPAPADYPVEFTDVRDLAEWMVRVAEERIPGVFNASGPAQAATLGGLLKTSRQISDSNARFVWTDDSFLQENGVQPWSQLPLWIGNGPEYAGFSRYDCSRAIAAGLTFRPVEETVAATLEWAQSRPAGYAWRAGLTPERETELLAKWAMERK